MAGDRIFNFNGTNVTFNDIHDNNNCTIVTAERKHSSSVPLPKENDYQAVLDWLQSEKEDGRDWYAINNNNRSAMCREISTILGWAVDQNSLRKAHQ